MIRRIVVMIVGIAVAVVVLPDAARSQKVKAKGIDSLDVRVNLQVQFNTTSQGDEPNSEWLLRRARLGVRAWIAGWIRADVEGDFGRGSPRLADGFVLLGFDPAFALRAGQFKRPYNANELVSSRQLLVAERDGAPRGTEAPTPDGLVVDLNYSDRDIGIEASGRRGRMRWIGGLWNGSGDNVPEADEGKQLAGRVEVEVAPTWIVGGAWTGAWQAQLEDPSEGAAYHAFELAVTGGTYQEPGWKALGNLMAGDNWNPEFGGGEDVTFVALQGIVGYHLPIFMTPFLIGVEPVARVGWTDPATDTDDDAAVLATGGVNLYLDERLKTQVQIDSLIPEEEGTEWALRVHTVLEF